jgi:DNA-binding response OmpR family regulator
MAMSALRVLVIEDNEALVASIFEYFELCGAVMDAAPNGISGLHLALINEYDTIVLDLMLPGMDGLWRCAGACAMRGV